MLIAFSKNSCPQWEVYNKNLILRLFKERTELGLCGRSIWDRGKIKKAKAKGKAKLKRRNEGKRKERRGGGSTINDETF